MKIVLIPLLSSAFYILALVYIIQNPCVDSGLFIGFCGFTQIIILTFLLFLSFYYILFLVFLRKKFGAQRGWKIYLTSLIISIVAATLSFPLIVLSGVHFYDMLKSIIF